MDESRETDAQPLIEEGNFESTRTSNEVTQFLMNQSYCLDSKRHKSEKKTTALSLTTPKGLAIAGVSVWAMMSMWPLALTLFASYFLFLKFGPKDWRDALMSMLLRSILKKFEHVFAKERKELFKDLGENDCVLDVGSGTGEYLRHVGRAARIVALEPNKACHSLIRENAKENGIKNERLEILSSTIEEYADSSVGQTFDWIVLGNVLCEVDSVHSTLSKVDFLLKPGGKVFFCEHVAAPSGTHRRILQDLLNPYWKVCVGGCNCNRTTMDEIKKISSWEVVSWSYDDLAFSLAGPFVIGLAAKRKAVVPSDGSPK